ncbi:MAG: type II secretion system F family protein [Verrucomicrobiota bacterium]|nr:type II secretion system F family protein [Verrucomicrobiota bacterium]
MSFLVTPSQLTQRAELYHQLGSTISAGIPLANALELIVNHPQRRSFRKPILQLFEQLQQGATFGEAMTQLRGWMPVFDVALLTAGEQSGCLDVCFKLLANYYRSRAQILRELIQGMTYTILTLHVFIFIFPLSYLVNIFTHNAIAPFLLQKLFIFGSLYGLVFLGIFACQGRRGENWRLMIEKMGNVIPLLGKARQFLALSRLSAALAALLNAGVSIVAAWELSAAASGSPALRRDVLSWKPFLESGETPAEMVNQSKLFPQLFSTSYQTAEVSGQQDDALQRLHNYYQEEGFNKMRLFTRAFNGLLYGIIVVMVVFQVFKFYLGYFGGIVNV